MSQSPYQGLPARAFWRSAVGERHLHDCSDLSRALPLSLADRYATAGSCFAQHIGRYLLGHGAAVLDMEPRPPFMAAEDASRFGFGIYSCRYGNVYTARQLLQLAQECLGRRTPAEQVWRRDERFFDALRPAVDPVGLASADEVLTARALHLGAVRRMFESLDVFVFTLGLTEAWVHRVDGTVYPTAAGTIAGSHDPAAYQFVNFRYRDVLADLQQFWSLLRSINPRARLVLTVSPVPLNATASPDHVLVATVRSKSVLRAVAADLADDHDDIHYFPSYEIIAAHPSRGMFFEPDLRNVNEMGVALVMRHFFAAFGQPLAAPVETADIICEEAELDRFTPP
jgi:hypothetical protein